MNKRYFWFSKRQDLLARRMDPESYLRTFCKLADGSIAEYSESKSSPKKSGWEDAVFLGTGVYDHSEEI